jgi:hypothetical protein
MNERIDLYRMSWPGGGKRMIWKYFDSTRMHKTLADAASRGAAWLGQPAQARWSERPGSKSRSTCV